MNNRINDWKQEYEKSKDRWEISKGVGRYHAKKSLDSYVGKTDGLVRWLDHPVNSLLIRSEIAGNGKTHLSVGILQEYTKRFVEKNGYTPLVLFASFTKLLLAIRSTYEDKHKAITDADIILTLGDIDLLIVDDFGAEKCTDFVLSTMYAIFNSRYENCLPTVFTTNLSHHEIKVNYSERILSRMSEGMMVDVKGSDKRHQSTNEQVGSYESVESFRMLNRIAHMKKLIEERMMYKLYPDENKLDGIMIEFV